MTSRQKIPFFYRAKIRDVLTQFQVLTNNRYSDTLFAPLREKEPDVRDLEALLLSLHPHDLLLLNSLHPTSGQITGHWKKNALISICAADPLLHVAPFVAALIAAKLDLPPDLAAKLLIEQPEIGPHLFARSLDCVISDARIASGPQATLKHVFITLASRGIAAPKHKIFLSRLKPHVMHFARAVNSMQRRADPNPKPAILLCALGLDPSTVTLGWMSKNLADRNRPEAALLHPSNHARRQRMRLTIDPGPEQIVQWQLRDLRRFFSPATQKDTPHG